MNELKKGEQTKGNRPVVFNDAAILASPRGPGAADASVSSPLVSESETREQMVDDGTSSESPSSHSTPLLRGLAASEKAAEHDSEITESSSGDSPASRPDAVMTAVPEAKPGHGSWKPSVPSSTTQVRAQAGTRDRTKEKSQDRPQEKAKDSPAGRSRGASQSGRQGSSRSRASWLAEDVQPSSSSTTPGKTEKKGWRNSMPSLSANGGLRAQLAPGDGSFDMTFNALMLPDYTVKVCVRFVDKMSPLIPREDGLNTYRSSLERLARRQVRKLNDEDLASVAANLFSVYASRCTAKMPLQKLALDVASLVCGQAMAEMAARPANSDTLSALHDKMVDSVVLAPGYNERFRGHHALMQYRWAQEQEKAQEAREKERAKHRGKKQESKREKEQARPAGQEPGQRAKAGPKGEKEQEKKQEKKLQKAGHKDAPKKRPKD